ncbi:MAG: serine hydrolase domain-containing protein [Candidatus Kapaibacterium sp.]
MRKFLLLFIIILKISVKAQTGVFVPELTLFDDKINSIMNKYEINGGQLAITYEGRLVYNRGFGLADTLQKTLVQPYSIFRLASVSKVITSIAIMKLFENNRFKLDDKVFGTNGILNDSIYKVVKDARIYQITIRQLLSHSSGFNFDFANEPLWKTYEIAIENKLTPPVYSFPIVLEWTLKNKELGFNPGTAAGYSNFGYTLLGLIIEKVTGKLYKDFVKDSILAPIGVTDMYPGKTMKEDKYQNEVSYYDYPGSPLSTSIFTGIPSSVSAQYGGYNWEIMTPAGGWVASARDLCKLLISVDRFSNKPDILLPSTIDTMIKKSINWKDYALGWFVTGNDYWHTGGIQGTATVIKRNESHQINYAILFNTLPKDYTPFYNEFIHLVTNEFFQIKSWPKHDLFTPTNSINNSDDLNSTQIINNSNGFLSVIDFKGIADIVNYLGVKVWSGFIYPNQKINVNQFENGVYFFKTYNFSKKFVLLKY